MPPQKYTNEIIFAAIEGFESQKVRLDTQIAELRAMLPGGHMEPVAPPKAPTSARRKMSAAVRKRMSDAQRKRWSQSKGETEATSSPVRQEASKPKHRLSAAGRKAISEATKKRWAEKKAAAVKAAPSVAKKSAAKKIRKVDSTAPAAGRS